MPGWPGPTWPVAGPGSAGGPAAEVSDPRATPRRTCLRAASVTAIAARRGAGRGPRRSAAVQVGPCTVRARPGSRLGYQPPRPRRAAAPATVTLTAASAGVRRGQRQRDLSAAGLVTVTRRRSLRRRCRFRNARLRQRRKPGGPETLRGPGPPGSVATVTALKRLGGPAALPGI